MKTLRDTLAIIVLGGAAMICFALDALITKATQPNPSSTEGGGR